MRLGRVATQADPERRQPAFAAGPRNQNLFNEAKDLAVFGFFVACGILGTVPNPCPSRAQSKAACTRDMTFGQHELP
jgi:hypothetical protein